MRRSFLLLCMLTTCFSTGLAQAPALNWDEVYYTGQGTNIGKRVLVGPDTAVYTLGEGGNFCYLAKYRSYDGQPQWGTQWDSATVAVDLALHPAGMVVAAWVFYNEPFNTPLDIGVSAYDLDGTLLWTFHWNDSLDRDDIVSDLHIDSNGDILLCATTEEVSGNPIVFNTSEAKQETTAHEVYVAPVVEPATFIEKEIEITVSPQEEIIPEDDDVASILLDKKPEIIAPLTDEPAEHPAVSEVTIPLIVDEDEISPETEPAPAVTAEESHPEIQEAAVTASDLGPLEREILLEANSSSIELEVSEGVGEYTEDAKSDNAVAVEESPVKAETQESLEDSEPLSMAEYLARTAKQIHFGEASEGQTTEITRWYFHLQEKSMPT